MYQQKEALCPIFWYLSRLKSQRFAWVELICQKHWLQVSIQSLGPKFFFSWLSICLTLGGMCHSRFRAHISLV